jgi:hypothetical protein
MEKGSDLLIFFVVVLLLVMSYSYIADQLATLAASAGASSFIALLYVLFPYLYFSILLGSMAGVLWKVFK